MGLQWRRSWKFFLAKYRVFQKRFLTISQHAFRFSKFSSGPWSLALSRCFSVVWSPAASHWCWWSWRGTPQQGQSGSWDDVRFVVSLDLQIPSDFVSFNLGVGWLLLAGWDAKHTQGMTWQTTQGLSCCSTLVLGVSFLGGVTEGWGSKTLFSSKGSTPSFDFCLFLQQRAASFSSLAQGRGSCSRFPRRWRSLVWFWTYCCCSGQDIISYPCMPAEDG